jgi:hypothetical protein
MSIEEGQSGRTVQGSISYFGQAPEKPTFHAQDHRRDNWQADQRTVTFHDARTWTRPPTLEREGVCVADFPTSIDFTDSQQVKQRYGHEIAEVVKALTGAKRVFGFPQGHMRFSPRSNRYQTGQNTQPAHFPHVDCSPNTAHGLIANSYFGAPKEELKPNQRLVGFNVWRVVSEPPQDWPLAACDIQTVDRDDLVLADGVYDYGEMPWMRAEAYLVRHNPRHRWIYFSDMRPDEALIFRAYGSEPDWIAPAPHTAFADPTCPPEAGGRISVESRCYAIFED